MLIWWLEWIQIHPLDAEIIGKTESVKLSFADVLLHDVFTDSIFWNSNKKKWIASNMGTANKKSMSNKEAIKFFWITKEDLLLAKYFNA